GRAGPRGSLERGGARKPSARLGSPRSLPPGRRVPSCLRTRASRPGHKVSTTAQMSSSRVSRGKRLQRRGQGAVNVPRPRKVVKQRSEEGASTLRQTGATERTREFRGG